MTGAEFRHWRMSRRWTQPITAEALGVSLRTIVSLENRETIPWLYVLAVRGVNVSGSDLPLRVRKVARQGDPDAIEAAVQKALGL